MTAQKDPLPDTGSADPGAGGASPVSTDVRRVDRGNPAHPAVHRGSLIGLALGAIGVVFGDIGTSPLYAMQTVFAIDNGAVKPTGHFGRRPIRVSWFLVFPALVLNYLGQGALILDRPESISNPFYLMAPS